MGQKEKQTALETASLARKGLNAYQSGFQQAGGYAPYVASFVGAANAAANFDKVPDDQKAAYVARELGLTVADYYTFGLARPTYRLLRKNPTIAKYGDKLERNHMKYTPGGILLSNLFTPPKTQEEEKRWLKLAKDKEGKIDPNLLPGWVRAGKDIKNKQAWSRKDLSPDFVGLAPTAGDAAGIGMTPAGTWVNNKFAKSRNVADLRPEDIWGYAAFQEKLGPSYMQTSEANRRAIAQKALEIGAVKEHHGTIDLSKDQELQNYWKSITTPAQPKPRRLVASR